MTITYLKTRFRLTAVWTILVGVVPIMLPSSAWAEGDRELLRRPLTKHVNLLYNYSDDFSESDVGLGWDVNFNTSKLFGTKGSDEREYGLKAFWETDGQLVFSSSGAVLSEAERNTIPLKASLGLSIFIMYHPEIPAGKYDDIDIVNPSVLTMGINSELPSRIESTEAKFSFKFYRTYVDMDVGWESDQSLDNSLFLTSASAILYNGYHGRQAELTTWPDYLSVMFPTLEVAFDAVHRTESSVTDLSATSNKNYTRFRGIASWRYHVGHHISPGTILHPLELYGAIQYSRDFGQNDGWEAAGQQESLGWFVEATYDLPGLHQTKLDGTLLFARFSSGRIAPILENENAFLVGLRKRF